MCLSSISSGLAVFVVLCVGTEIAQGQIVEPLPAIPSEQPPVLPGASDIGPPAAERDNEDVKVRVAKLRADHAELMERAVRYAEQTEAAQKNLAALRSQRAKTLHALASDTLDAALTGERASHDIVGAYTAVQQAELATLTNKKDRLRARTRHVATLQDMEMKFARQLKGENPKFTSLDLHKAKAVRLAAEIEAMLEAAPETDSLEIRAAVVRAGVELQSFLIVTSRNAAAVQGGSVREFASAGAAYHEARANIQLLAGDDDHALIDLAKAYEFRSQEFLASAAMMQVGVEPVEVLRGDQSRKLKTWRRLNETRRRLGHAPLPFRADQDGLDDPAVLEDDALPDLPSGTDLDAAPRTSPGE